jgi:hypothetical protein
LSYDSVSTGLSSSDAASQQAFVLVTSESTSIQQLDTDGILGLAFSSLSDGESTFVESLAAQGVISSALFSIYLSNNDFEGTDYTSNIILGGYDVQAYADKDDDQIKYIDVVAAYWQVRLKKVQFDGDDIDTVANYAILDTGTSLLVAPYADYAYIVNELSAKYEAYIVNNQLAYKCNSASDMPGIEFQLGSYQFKLAASSIFSYDSQFCYFLIDSSNLSFWILGDVFLRNYYVIYDMDNLQVGLVGSITKKSDSDSSSSDLPDWAIAVIVIAGVVVLVVAAVGVYIKRRRQRGGAHNEPFISNPA